MTVCVYHNDVLAADSRVTLGGTIGNEHVIKIGLIYEDLVSKERSLDKTTLKYPVEFAMYALAGSCRHFNRFLRWFVSVDHAGIDHNESFAPEEVEDIDEAIEVMVVFKNYDFIRLYDQDYTKDVFTDLPKTDSIHTIGSGGLCAQAILTYDPWANLVDVVKAVTKVDVFCGGDIKSLRFGDDPEYDEEELKEASKAFADASVESVISSLKEAGIEVSLVSKDDAQKVSDESEEDSFVLFPVEEKSVQQEHNLKIFKA